MVPDAGTKPCTADTRDCRARQDAQRTCLQCGLKTMGLNNATQRWPCHQSLPHPCACYTGININDSVVILVNRAAIGGHIHLLGALGHQHVTDLADELSESVTWMSDRPAGTSVTDQEWQQASPALLQVSKSVTWYAALNACFVRYQV